MRASALGLIGIVLAAFPARPFPRVERPVASIVSPIWGDGAQRDGAREVDQIVARLRLRPGMTVADIGAGDGCDTLRLARVLGPRGTVIAEDVTPGYLAKLRGSVAARRVANVRIVLGEPGDPKLAPRSIDAAIMVHMYHEVTQPYALLARLAPAFRPGGRLGVEELDRPTRSHGTPPKILTCELEAAGYRTLGLAPLEGGLGYFAVFAPPPIPRPPDPRAAAACRA